jgi:hypothetical protein
VVCRFATAHLQKFLTVILTGIRIQRDKELLSDMLSYRLQMLEIITYIHTTICEQYNKQYVEKPAKKLGKLSFKRNKASIILNVVRAPVNPNDLHE